MSWVYHVFLPFNFILRKRSHFCLTMYLLENQFNTNFFLFCRAGYLPQNIPLEIIRYLSEEKDFLPWHAASRALYPLDKLLDRTENYNIFNVRDAAFVSLFLSSSLSAFIAKTWTIPQLDTVNDLGILTFFLIILHLNIAIVKLWFICIWTVTTVVWGIYN